MRIKRLKTIAMISLLTMFTLSMLFILKTNSDVLVKAEETNDLIQLRYNSELTLTTANNTLITDRTSYDESNAIYLRNVFLGQTIANLAENFTNTNLHFLDSSGSNLTEEDVVRTNSQIEIYNADNSIKDKIIIVLKGDINGDGVIDNLDKDVLNLYLSGTQPLTGAFKLAADINNNGSISSTDIVALNNHILGEKLIFDVNKTSTLKLLIIPTVTISESGLASWNSVENAISYMYIIDSGAEISTTETSLQLSGTQSIKVKAVGDKINYPDSEYSESKTYAVKLSIPNVMLANSGMARFICGYNSGFIIKFIDEEKTIKLNSIYLWLKDGQSFQVKAVGDGVKYLDSDYSYIYTYNIPFNKNLFNKIAVKENTVFNIENYNETVSLQGFCLSDYIPVSEYFTVSGLSTTVLLNNEKLRIVGYDSDFGYSGYYTKLLEAPFRSFEVNEFSEDIAYIRFSLSMNDLDTCKVEYGETATYYSPYTTKLATPTVKIDADGLAKWTAIEGAFGYAYTIDGKMQITTENSIQLLDGQTITVKALGYEMNNTVDSEYSESKTFKASVQEDLKENSTSFIKNYWVVIVFIIIIVIAILIPKK